MKEVIRMYQSSSTADALVEAARQLFSQHGYDGTSVRAITRHAGTNLGAITYHFGSKEALYEVVLAAVNQGVDDRLMAAAQTPGPPLDRIGGFVQALFDVFAENPDYPQLIMHELARERPLPEGLRQALERRIGTLASLIREGQEDGSIRTGDPMLMALSVGSQPLWITLAARPVQEGARIDQTDPKTRKRLVGSVVEFVRAGLAAHPEKRE
jgi:AcrR family transcriptional regulator